MRTIHERRQPTFALPQFSCSITVHISRAVLPVFARCSRASLACGAQFFDNADIALGPPLNGRAVHGLTTECVENKKQVL